MDPTINENRGTAKLIQNWYFGDISMEESEFLLSKYGVEGDFIVRDSSGVSPIFNIFHGLSITTSKITTYSSNRLGNLALN